MRRRDGWAVHGVQDASHRTFMLDVVARVERIDHVGERHLLDAARRRRLRRPPREPVGRALRRRLVEESDDALALQREEEEEEEVR